MSKHYPDTQVRKPRQARAKFTRESLIDAATQVLQLEGYEAFNTNRVAEQAGGSIGSLYQYFPDTQALIEAIVVRHVASLAGSIGASFGKASTLPLGEATDMLVQATIDFYADDLALHRVVHQQIPHRETEVVVGSTMTQLIHWLSALLVKHQAQIRSDLNPDMAANMIVYLIKDTTCRLVLGNLSGAAVETAKKELCLMVKSYLGINKARAMHA